MKTLSSKVEYKYQPVIYAKDKIVQSDIFYDTPIEAMQSLNELDDKVVRNWHEAGNKRYYRYWVRKVDGATHYIRRLPIWQTKK